MTLNFIRQWTFNRTISSWEYFTGPFQYDATPLGPLGINFIIHKNASRRHLWDFIGKDGWNLGAAMDHYRFQKVVSEDTKTEMVSDTIEFRHHKLTLHSVTPEDKVLHGVQQLTKALKNTPSSTVDAQTQAIKARQDTIGHWSRDTKAPIATDVLPRFTLSTNMHRSPRVPTEKPGTPPAPRVDAPPPRMQTILTEFIQANHQTINQHMSYQSGPKQLEPATTI